MVEFIEEEVIVTNTVYDSTEGLGSFPKLSYSEFKLQESIFNLLG